MSRSALIARLRRQLIDAILGPKVGGLVEDGLGSGRSHHPAAGQRTSASTSTSTMGEGRPFVIDGVPRTAALVTLGKFGVESPDHPRLPGPIRHHLARRWISVAQNEHSSVASFARFTAQLLHVGAPPQLVRASCVAASDEVRHAHISLELAEELAGLSFDFGPLATRSAYTSDGSLLSVVLACIAEGCVGETLSALEFTIAASRCGELSLGERLQSIASDEGRHATLAWSFVAWALERCPEFHDTVAGAFVDAAVEASPAALEVELRECGEEPDDELMLSRGCLPAQLRVRVRREGLRELIAPCVEALLSHGENKASLG